MLWVYTFSECGLICRWRRSGVQLWLKFASINKAHISKLKKKRLAHNKYMHHNIKICENDKRMPAYLAYCCFCVIFRAQNEEKRYFWSLYCNSVSIVVLYYHWDFKEHYKNKQKKKENLLATVIVQKNGFDYKYPSFCCFYNVLSWLYRKKICLLIII